MVWKLSPLKRSCFSLYFRIRSAAWNKGINSLKGQCHDIFDFRFFSWISFPWVTHEGRFEFFRTNAEIFAAQGSNLPPCCWYRRCTLTCEYINEFPKNFEMILTLYSGAWGKMIHEKNLKLKISRHCPFKTSLTVGSNLPPVLLIPAVHLGMRITPRIFKKIRNVYSGSWGKMIHEKNLKLKISWHCPYKTSLTVRPPGANGNTIYARRERFSLKRRHFDSLL